MKINTKTTFAGMDLDTPLVLLSGCVGFGEDLLRLEAFDFSAVGAICLKGTTLEPRYGNAPPRLAETPCGMLNAIGLQNPGARHVVKEILPRLQKLSMPTRWIANIAGSSVEAYAEVARIFDDSFVDAMEINISCPNVKAGGAAFGADSDTAFRVVTAVRDVTQKPLITKLSPNVTDIQRIADAVMDAGTDALSAINTVMGMAVNHRTAKPILGAVQGGFSGPAIKPIALLNLWRIYQVAAPRGIPILGQGGCSTAEDVLEFFIAGASAVGIGTALFHNPLLCQKLLKEVRREMQRHYPSLTTISELTGKLDVS